MQLSTTFNLAHQANACESSYRKMGKALGGIAKYGKNTPFTLAKVLEVCGFDDALWCLRCPLPEQEALNRKLLCLFLADCLEHVEHLMLDERSKAVIPLLRRRAVGQATDEEIRLVAASAYAAARAAHAASASAYAAASAWAAAYAAWAAASAWAPAYAATAHAWQTARLMHYLTTEEM